MKAVIEAHTGGNIRAMMKVDSVSVATLLVQYLEYCARMYSGAPNTERQVFAEMADWLIKHYPQVSPKEIKLAFELAAARKTTADLKSYYGLFTVEMLGDVLSSYRAYTKANRDAINAEQHRLDSEHLTDEMKHYWTSSEVQKELKRREELRIKKLYDIQNITLNDIYYTDFKMCERRGWIVLSGAEKWNLVDQARGIYLEQLKQKKIAAPYFHKPPIAKSIKTILEGGLSDEDFKQCTDIAQRLAVLNFIKSKQRENGGCNKEDASHSNGATAVLHNG